MTKELCWEIYTAVDVANACRRLIVFYDFVAHAEVPELVRLAKAISTWETEILAFHTTGGLSIGPTEGINTEPRGSSGRVRLVNFRHHRVCCLLYAGKPD